jgi:hypothetical protein
MKTLDQLAPGRFFASYDGTLSMAYGIPGPSIVRTDYERHHAKIKTGRELRATLRAGDTTWPGMYPLYFVTDDGAALSFAAVRENLHQIIAAIRSGDIRGGWRVIACEVNYEDPGLFCDHSGERIPSAYAED